jgi:hypothetical protein
MTNGTAGPPTGPLRYSDRDRKRDYRRGRADARRHLPLVPRHPPLGTRTSQLAVHGANGTEPGQAAPSISLTPFLYGVFNQRNQDLAALRRLYLDQRNQLLDALREADGKRQQLLVKQAVAQERLEQLSQPLTEEESTRVTYGELKAGHPEELTRTRRARAREQARQNAQRQLDDINGKLHEAAVAAGKAQGAIATKLAETQAVGVEIVSYYEQRKASYLGGLAHTHRRNVELVEQLKLMDPGLPDWLSWSPTALGGT